MWDTFENLSKVSYGPVLCYTVIMIGWTVCRKASKIVTALDGPRNKEHNGLKPPQHLSVLLTGSKKH